MARFQELRLQNLYNPLAPLRPFDKLRAGVAQDMPFLRGKEVGDTSIWDLGLRIGDLTTH